MYSRSECKFISAHCQVIIFSVEFVKHLYILLELLVVEFEYTVLKGFINSSQTYYYSCSSYQLVHLILFRWMGLET